MNYSLYYYSACSINICHHDISVQQLICNDGRIQFVNMFTRRNSRCSHRQPYEAYLRYFSQSVIETRLKTDGARGAIIQLF